MFVSLLQLMGFPLAKPVHSRAKEVVQSQPSKARIEGITAMALAPAANTKLISTGKVHAQANSARRHEVKAQPGKPKGTTQVVVKAKSTAKVKVQEKDTVKTTTAKASNPEVVVSKPKVTHSVKPGTLAKAAMPTKPEVATPVQVEASAVPARAGRPSSRLAQLTVPSMAQSVASTAAKASFTQTATAPIIVPPLASAVKKDPALANNWKLKPVEQLTDADVMAMPDDEYMNDTQLAFFRLKLSVLKKDILSNAGETTEHLREETVVVPDPTDRATIEEEHALELRTRDRERKLLKKIEQSIVRIDAGEYGYCDETGEPIGVGRLLARPTANLSLEAQQRRELRQKMFGD